ncbi:putative hydrolase, CocE/NonD family [Solimonas aquatica]|uniref:Putative hydrolase, CocE/NonD family n=1 Tax=Solimonas aquatica TaxID=489703 RepID=A0A1H9GGL3_9GAMM|nr:CocE/NonD family hydrolase [Solimonas aquatica]SEQ49173.1 putative hydrolase, CocE/NonD family [Solimonas aquatica]
MSRWRGLLLALAVALPTVLPAAQQSFEFRTPASAEDPRLMQDMHDLALRMLPVYEEREPQRFLANLSALQLLAGNVPAAFDTRLLLLQRRLDGVPLQNEAMVALLDLYTQARSAASHAPFALAFAQAWRQRLPKLGDAQAALLARWLQTPQSCFAASLQQRLDAARAQPELDIAGALDLSWAYLSWQMHRELGVQGAQLLAEDAAQRYVSEERLRIRSADGAELWLRLVRPKAAEGALPAVLELRLDDAPGEAQLAAAHGYVGVVLYARGQRGPGAPTPRSRLRLFAHEGEDARAAIAWIRQQPWSDGRVAMVGSGYSAYAAWAAARLHPPALKAIAVANAMAPGIDFPAPGRVYDSAAYRYLAEHAYSGAPRELGGVAWQQLEAQWARSQQPYYQFGLPGEAANALFRLWLGHPTFDSYWRRLTPYREAFADIDIPVLSLSGSQARHRAAALYYFQQHLRARPQAEHRLLFGPYDDEDLREAPCARRGAEPLDAVARIDLHELRYQWLDQQLHEDAAPDVLRGRVNLQLAGANRWLHGEDLQGLAPRRQRFYLTPSARLGAAAAPAAYSEQSLDFQHPGTKGRHGRTLTFRSEPLAQPLAVAGVLDGELSLMLNKLDFDWQLALYEQKPDGRLLALAPAFVQRASYARDITQRQLLRGARRERLPIQGPVMARQLAAGSRLLLTLELAPRLGRQINHGSGKDVSEETAADALMPLLVRWYGDSYIELPLAP